jgi:hypothetical protein
MMRTFLNTAATAVALLLTAIVFSPTGEAHKAVTSKYTYNADVHPIFVNRCGHCHIAGGVGPMSLVTYEEAFPWAESLRTELLDAEDGDANDFVRAAHQDLSARELDVIVDWAVGGTPEGDPANAPQPVVLKNDWAGEKPDLVLQPAAAFQIPGDSMEITHEFVLPSGVARERQISAIDLLPGSPAVVRDATVFIRAPNAAPNIIGSWTPRQSPAAIAVKPGTPLPQGADLIARIHYKKTWKYEGQAITDQSSIGIYFADK